MANGDFKDLVAYYHTSEQNKADSHAKSIGGYTQFHNVGESIRGRSGKYGQTGWYVYRPPAQSSGGNTAGGGTGGTIGQPPPAGTAPGPAGADAIETLNPQIKLGGKSFEIGPGNDNVVSFNRESSFRGIETAVPDAEIVTALSPHTINFDGRVPGSLCVRKGLLKYSENLLTSEQTSNSGAALSASWNGLDILWLQPNDNSGATNVGGVAAMVYGASKSIGAAGNGNIQVATTGPLHAPPRDIVGRPGPVISVSKNSLTVDLDVTAYPNHPTNANDVVAIVVRLSTVGYPESIDGKDDKASVVFTDGSGDEYDRLAWDGDTVSETHDTDFESGDTVYATCWAVSRQGVSEPSYSQVDI